MKIEVDLKWVVLVIKENIVRRSVSFPKELDERIDILKQQFSYNVKNELIIELIEKGLLVFYEDTELKNKIDKCCDRIDAVLDKLEID